MVSMLFPTWTYAEMSAYDELIIQARDGDRQPLLQYLAVREKQTQLTAGEIADWLQVSSWANNDVETLAVWDRYRQSMAIPARGQVAAARALRNQKQWNDSLAVWETVLQDEPGNSDARTGSMPIATSRPSPKPGAGQTRSRGQRGRHCWLMFIMLRGKTGIQYWRPAKSIPIQTTTKTWCPRCWLPCRPTALPAPR